MFQKLVYNGFPEKIKNIRLRKTYKNQQIFIECFKGLKKQIVFTLKYCYKYNFYYIYTKKINIRRNRYSFLRSNCEKM